MPAKIQMKLIIGKQASSLFLSICLPSPPQVNRRTSMTPPNPLKLTIPPRGHWCNINGPARRRARSLTAKRSAD